MNKQIECKITFERKAISLMKNNKHDLRCAAATPQVAMCGRKLRCVCRTHFGCNLRCACVQCFLMVAKCDHNFARFFTKKGSNFISNLNDDFSEKFLRYIMCLCVENW